MISSCSGKRCSACLEKETVSTARSEAQRQAQVALDDCEVGIPQSPQPVADHAALDRSHDARDDGRQGQAGLVPTLDQVISNEQPPDVTGDGRHEHLASACMISLRTQNQGRPPLRSRFVCKDEPYEHYGAALKACHTRRRKGCPTALRERDPKTQSGQPRQLTAPVPDRPAGVLPRLPTRTVGWTDPFALQPTGYGGALRGTHRC